MGTRVQLQSLLENVLQTGNVYFQPPPSVKMNYPCIVYELSKMEGMFADGKPYVTSIRYTVTVIDKDPDSEIPKKVAALPMCSFDRSYQAANLNHYIFNLYY